MNFYKHTIKVRHDGNPELAFANAEDYNVVASNVTIGSEFVFMDTNHSTGLTEWFNKTEFVDFDHTLVRPGDIASWSRTLLIVPVQHEVVE